MFSINHIFEQVEPETDFLSKEHEQWLKKHIILPYQNYCTYARSILFFGPSGNGKTSCVYAFSKRLCMPVLSIACQETLQENFINVTVHLQSLFIQASETQSIFHLDDIEFLVGRQNSTTISLVKIFKGFLEQYSDVIVIGTTSDINLLDSSVRCQFNHEIYFDYFSLPQRTDFLHFLLNKNQHQHQLDLSKLASKMEKFTMTEISHSLDMAVINRLMDSDSQLRDYHFNLQSPENIECEIFNKWKRNVSILLLGKNTYKHIFVFEKKLELVYSVNQFPVVQRHFKFYIIKHIGIYTMSEVVEFLEWCSLNKKIVIATSFPKLPECITCFFGMLRHIK